MVLNANADQWDVCCAMVLVLKCVVIGICQPICAGIHVQHSVSHSALPDVNFLAAVAKKKNILATMPEIH